MSPCFIYIFLILWTTVYSKHAILKAKGRRTKQRAVLLVYFRPFLSLHMPQSTGHSKLCGKTPAKGVEYILSIMKAAGVEPENLQGTMGSWNQTFQIPCVEGVYFQPCWTFSFDPSSSRKQVDLAAKTTCEPCSPARIFPH